jgi:hypothetical protein
MLPLRFKNVNPRKDDPLITLLNLLYLTDFSQKIPYPFFNHPASESQNEKNNAFLHHSELTD